MEVGKISEGIQATIDLLESTYIPTKDMETLGFAVLTALKNLKIIKEATVKAENGEPFGEPPASEVEPEIEIVPIPEPEEAT